MKLLLYKCDDVKSAENTIFKGEKPYISLNKDWISLEVYDLDLEEINQLNQIDQYENIVYPEYNDWFKNIPPCDFEQELRNEIKLETEQDYFCQCGGTPLPNSGGFCKDCI